MRNARVTEGLRTDIKGLKEEVETRGQTIGVYVEKVSYSHINHLGRFF